MNMKKLIGGSIFLGLIVAAPLAFAQTSNPGVFPPDAGVFGRTYGEWSAKWWQWNFSIPISSNPTFDTTGQSCDVQQSLPVFFLAGIATGEPVTRECTVPSEKPLFFPLINAECSNVEDPPFHGDTPADRLACVQAVIDGVSIGSLEATVDGVGVAKLKDFRVQSPDFHFSMPAHNNILFLDGVTSGFSTSDGYWLMLRALSPGHHVIHFKAAVVSGVGKGFSQDVTYNLTVK